MLRIALENLFYELTRDHERNAALGRVGALHRVRVAEARRAAVEPAEDAKRIERERKNLVEERTRIVGRIKGLLALHGIWLSSKRIGKGLLARLDTMMTGDGRPLPPFLRRDIERMIRHYEFICDQLARSKRIATPPSMTKRVPFHNATRLAA